MVFYRVTGSFLSSMLSRRVSALLTRSYKGTLPSIRMAHSTKVAVCQMTSTNNKSSNIDTATSLIKEAASKGAKVVFLPEAFDYIGKSKEESKMAAEPLTGPTITHLRRLAEDMSVWISLGGFKEKSSDPDRPFNTHLVVDSSGQLAGVYRKLHLFNVDIPGKVRLAESDFTSAGSELSPLIDSPAGQLALGICYDMRFPEMATLQRQQGAHILTYPSAFTVPTGKAHWHILLRARAIEHQCFVIAAAQVGHHNEKRESYGHSLIVDPWGEVLADLETEVGVAVAELDLEKLAKHRLSLPVQNNKRHDIYKTELNSSDSLTYSINEREVYDFAQFPVPSSCVFARSKFSYAFVNKKPVLNGHVLVSPVRVAPRFPDLTREETEDLFELVRKVTAALEEEYSCSSVTISIQDGPDAGQSVQHVHVHIIPRHEGDFQSNDDIYDKLAKHDKNDSGELLPQTSPQWRTVDVMAEEAGRMRKYFI